jgi:iron complex transport system substrate-binding protein
MRKTVQDDLQRDVSFAFPPRRVVSLCPSLTETLFALGLDEGTIVGRTRYCIHPAEDVQRVPTVGGTRDVHIESVRELGPDLVIATKEENPRQVVEALAETLPVFVCDVTDYESALRAITSLGGLTDRLTKANQLVAEIRAAFGNLKPARRRTVAYLLWREPYMAAGRNTYIHSLLEKCGFDNVGARLPKRYPQITIEELRALQPEYVLLSSEPFPFDESHVAELAPQVPSAQVLCVDGEMFGWYGSRMLAAPAYLKRLIAELDAPRAR